MKPPTFGEIGCTTRPAHKTLRLEVDDGRRRWQLRLPAMVAGLADRIWAVKELLMAVVPPDVTRTKKKLPIRLPVILDSISKAGFSKAVAIVQHIQSIAVLIYVAVLYHLIIPSAFCSLDAYLIVFSNPTNAIR